MAAAAGCSMPPPPPRSRKVADQKHTMFLPTPKPPKPPIPIHIKHPPALPTPIQRANTSVNLEVARSNDLASDWMVSSKHAFPVALPAVSSLHFRELLVRTRVVGAPWSSGLIPKPAQFIGMNQQKEEVLEVESDYSQIRFAPEANVMAVSFRIGTRIAEDPKLQPAFSYMGKLWIKVEFDRPEKKTEPMIVHPKIPLLYSAVPTSVLAVCIFADSPILSVAWYPARYTGDGPLNICDLSTWSPPVRVP